MAASQLSAQTSSDSNADFKARYERQVNAVGVSGVGVEYILDKWKKACPESVDMLRACATFYFAKSREEKVVPKNGAKYLGREPVLTLTDSLGAKVNYFTDYAYDDAVFGKFVKTIDQAIALYPEDLGFRTFRLTGLMEYEKESPDMAASGLVSLIDYDASAKPHWVYEGSPVSDTDFVDMVQDYCGTLFKIGTPSAYESFRNVSEKMVSLHPKDTRFLGNLGSYWLVAQKNNSKAMSYYKKVLKIDPKDYAAIKNCVLMARHSNNTGMEKKYLPLLIEVTPSASEKAAAEARLKQL